MITTIIIIISVAEIKNIILDIIWTKIIPAETTIIALKKINPFNCLLEDAIEDHLSEMIKQQRKE